MNGKLQDFAHRMMAKAVEELSSTGAVETVIIVARFDGLHEVIQVGPLITSPEFKSLLGQVLRARVAHGAVEFVAMVSDMYITTYTDVEKERVDAFKLNTSDASKLGLGTRTEAILVNVESAIETVTLQRPYRRTAPDQPTIEWFGEIMDLSGGSYSGRLVGLFPPVKAKA